MVIQNNAKHKSEYIWEHDFGISFREEINDIPYLTSLLVVASHFEKYAQVKLISLSSNSPLKKMKNFSTTVEAPKHVCVATWKPDQHFCLLVVSVG